MKALFRLAVILSLVSSALWPSSIEYKSFDATTLQKLVAGEILSHIQLLPNSKTYRCELMGLIQAPIHEVWEVISDYSRYHEFMPRTPVTFLVDPEALNSRQEENIANWNRFEEELMNFRVSEYGDNPFYFYNRFKMPFPLKDRHYILKVERFSEIFRSQWIEILGNTRVNTGSWTLVSFEEKPGTTLAVYSLDVNTGINLPAKIIQEAMKKLPEIIRSLRQHIREVEYRNESCGK
jgi:hypothetical protein